jgi:hypothetical protein
MTRHIARAFGIASYLTMVLIVMATICVLLAPLTQARNLGQYDQVPQDQRDWFSNLKSKAGSQCCADADGYDAQWDTKDGKFRVFGIAGWIVVPDDAVVREPNKVGVAKVWWVDKEQKTIRCFLEGTEG